MKSYSCKLAIYSLFFGTFFFSTESRGCLKMPNVYPTSSILNYLPSDMLRIVCWKTILTNLIPDAKEILTLKVTCKKLHNIVHEIVRKEGEKELSQLFDAVKENNFAKVKQLGDFVIKVNTAEAIFFNQDKDGNTLFHHAARAHIDIIKYLQIMYNTYKNGYAKSAKLIKAVEHNDIEKLKKLLKVMHPDSGIRLNMIPNNDGKRPSEIARQYSNQPLIQLPARAMYGDRRNMFTFLHSFVLIEVGDHCCFETIEMHSKKRCFCDNCITLRLNLTLPKTFTALMQACVHNNREAVSLLLSHGANPNIQIDESIGNYTFKSTALMLTTDAKIIHLLLKNGAQPNLQDLPGHTALTYALKRKDVSSVKLLLQAIANVNLGPFSIDSINGRFKDFTAFEYFYNKVINEKPSSEKDREIIRLLKKYS